MKKTIAIAVIAAAAMLSAGCTRIETGEVGLRVNASKQIEGTELREGTWNQTLVGSVLTIPVRDIALVVKNATPMTSENTRLKELDFTVIYALQPEAVSEFWSQKSKSFHMLDSDGDWLLMYRYMETTANNAAQKVIRKYEALKVTDNREQIEREIADVIQAELTVDKLHGKIIITSVKVQVLQPNDAIVESATALVKAQNQLAVAATNVQIAQKESERMAALAQNAGQSIAYMNAQALGKIADGVANGKVQTIVVPYDFKGIVNVK